MKIHALLFPAYETLDAMGPVEFLYHAPEVALYGNGVFFGVGEMADGRLYPRRLCALS